MKQISGREPITLIMIFFELERSILHSSDNTESSLELHLDEPRLGLKAFADI
ncbi:unnamed protein product [Brassica oleracea var. botrytis]|uniref:Uncharacterized protein n=1 Tax=Brassica oleracea var. oleracea TaxID=109376 RepID=A0A0D3AAI7_BRAOL